MNHNKLITLLILSTVLLSGCFGGDKEPEYSGQTIHTGTLTVDSFNSAGFVKNDANGLLSGGNSGGAPTDANYLVGTANGDLSAEIVVGATPGGELSGTWTSPTIDATHSGSVHHAAVTLVGTPNYLTLSSQAITLTVLDINDDTDLTVASPLSLSAGGQITLDTSGTWTGNAGTATQWATGRTITLTGEVTGTSGSFDGTANLSFAATIGANSVDGTNIALGSDATGDIMYYNGTNYVRLGIGSPGEVLEVSAGNIPEWDTDDSGGGGETFINQTSATQIQAEFPMTAAFANKGANETITEANLGHSRINSTGNGWAAGVLTGISSDAVYQMDTAKDLDIEFWGITNDATGERCWGITGDAGASTDDFFFDVDYAVASFSFIGFCHDGTNLIFKTSDNNVTTTSTVSGITITNWNKYGMTWDGGVSVAAYVNGTLRYTHSTTTPSDATDALFGAGAANSSDWIRMTNVRLQLEI